MIRLIFSLLAAFLGIYSLFVIIRIIFTWFSGVQYSKPAAFLSRVTDPYLNWWRRNFRLRAGVLDLSPLAGMAALSVAQVICSTIAREGRIGAGIILALCVSALFSIVSFILGFCFIVLVLRLIAWFSNSNMYSPFWQVIDTISRPLMYRLNRIIFGRKIVNFLTGIIVPIITLSVLMIVAHVARQLLTGLLLMLPL